MHVTCIGSRLKLNFERRANLGVDDHGHDFEKAETDPQRRVMLIGFDDCLVARFIQIYQEIWIGRTSWEFERYGNVEIPQFINDCIVISTAGGWSDEGHDLFSFDALWTSRPRWHEKARSLVSRPVRESLARVCHDAQDIEPRYPRWLRRIRACEQKRIRRVLISSTFVLGASHSSSGVVTKERGAEQVRHLLCVVLWAHAGVNSDEIRPKANWKAQHGRHWHEHRERNITEDTPSNVEDGMA